jgi:membrane fusion protein (multidrug efflux system)
MKSSSIVLVAVALAVGAGAGYWVSSSKSPASPPAASAPGGSPAGAAARPGGPPPVSVEATLVKTVSLPQTLSAVGSLRSDESVMLRPEVAGRIQSIGFREGERVRRGQVLFQLDDALPRAEVEQARANVSLAQAKAQRAAELHAQGFISQQARDEAENTLKVANAALSLAEARLARMTIRAPFDGLIALRNVSVGDFVREGQDLVNLEAIDTLKVDFRLPEAAIAQLRVGQTLQLALDALPNVQAEGKVYAISPLVDAAGRSVLVRAQVSNRADRMRPGMFARVRLLLNEAAQALVVPETALVPQGADQFVFRIREGRVSLVRIEIGQRSAGQVEVLRGLEAGDQIVTAGQLKLREGVAVKVAGET